MYQTEIVSLNDLVSEQHMYRKFASIWQLKNVESELSKIEEASDHKGYGIFRLFKCLLL